jgi:hypothetical protein
MMWTKFKVWAAIITGVVIAVLTGYSSLKRKRRRAEARQWVGIAKAREAKVAADNAKTLERRAEYTTAKKDYQDYSKKAEKELEVIDARLQKRKDGRLGTLLARYDELRRGG